MTSQLPEWGKITDIAGLSTSGRPSLPTPPERGGGVCSLRQKFGAFETPELKSGFLLKSSNDRRALSGVSPNSDARERNLQITHTPPVGSLFTDSPKPRPTISTEQSVVGRLTVSLISRQRRASRFELDGNDGVVSRKSHYQKNARHRNQQEAWYRELKSSSSTFTPVKRVES